MNPTLFELGVAVAMLAVSVAMVVSFIRHMATTSEARMLRMLARVGGGPALAGQDAGAAIPHDARSRCRSCPSEDLCDRWLAGKIAGANDFCPNARIFSGLTRSAAP